MRSLLLGRRTVDVKAESRLLRGTATTHFYSFTVLIRAELSGRLRAIALRAEPLALGRGFRCALHASPVAVPGLLAGPLGGREGMPRPVQVAHLALLPCPLALPPLPPDCYVRLCLAY